jgi:hypothetical protein
MPYLLRICDCMADLKYQYPCPSMLNANTLCFIPKCQWAALVNIYTQLMQVSEGANFAKRANREHYSYYSGHKQA